MSAPVVDETTRPPLPRLRLLYVLTVGIVAWFAHLVGSAALVGASCAHGAGWAINLLTVVTALVAASGIPVALGLKREFEPYDDVRSRTVVWLAWIGIALEAINLGLILLEGVPNLVLDPCG